MSKDNAKQLNSNTSGKNNFISADDLRLVKDIPVYEVIEKYLSLTKNGAGYKALCPFHNEKTPSFNVPASGEYFHCFGCKKTGDAISFVEEKKRLSYPEAVREIARDHGITLHEEDLSEEELTIHKKKEEQYDVNRWASKWFADQLYLPENALALEYVKNRWSDESILAFGIGAAPESWDKLIKAAKEAGYKEGILLEAGLISKSEKYGKENVFDTFRKRIIFPIHNKHGRVAGFAGRIYSGETNTPKYLNIRDTVVYHKSEILYGLHTAHRSIKQQKNAYLVEGYADVIRLHEIDI
ncbi:MAG: DNA primase [Bacteroidota bacterium]